MKLIFSLLSGLLLAAPIARAQTGDDLQISVSGFAVAANGAERSAGVSFRVAPITIDKPSVGVFSMFDCGYFSVTVPANPFKDGATGGWRVEITPVKVADAGVTFRLRWVRGIDKSAGLSPANEDVELTLKPGESRPLDTVPVPAGAKTLDGRPCAMKTASLRVSVDFPDMDRRLIGATLWLVHRLPNGRQLVQDLSIRGVPHRPIPFYFNSKPFKEPVEGDKSDGRRLDIFGKLVVDPAPGGFGISLETVKARADEGQKGYQAAEWFRSTVQMTANEIVEVALPQSDEKGGVSSSGAFSIRIQAKQLR
jgi:hypothetical protein